ncbi:YscW family type III secretion system pilotin ExsB [Pseudomonas aeruginosa]|nr:YscW family type III secretion system pilotin ExsB [Pseudomonas aeruginosa]
MLLPLALLLGGCVSQPAPMSPKVTVGGSVGGSVGGVSLQARQAQLRLRLYVVVQGRMQTIAERRYRVSGLPLRYAFDLEVDRLEGEALYLRTELSWVGVAAVQASAWQRVAAGVDERVRLVRRDCFPNCTAARPEERSGND